MLHKPRVGVIRGGPSTEHEVSLLTGANVLDCLNEKYPNKYSAYDIKIDRDGNWYFENEPIPRGEIGSRIDVAFNALHGSYGEDGKIQHLFESYHIPFTGSPSLSSALAMNKQLAKKAFREHGLKTPVHRVVTRDDIENRMPDILLDFYHSLILPVIVKPRSGGSSVGVKIVNKYEDFPVTLRELIQHDEALLVEDLIKGVEATCGIVENFRGQELYALPPIEIRPMSSFFDYEAKYGGQSQEIVPATFSHKIKEAIQELSRKIHRALNLRHYSRSDFIIHPKRGIYVLEVNTLPGLTSESLVPKSLRAVGSDTHELVDHLIELTLGSYTKR